MVKKDRGAVYTILFSTKSGTENIFYFLTFHFGFFPPASRITSGTQVGYLGCKKCVNKCVIFIQIFGRDDVSASCAIRNEPD